jgi:hypothetical protein
LYAPHLFVDSALIVLNCWCTDGKDKQQKKWATFTHIGKQTRFITKLFKNTNIRTAYKTLNTIRKQLQKWNQEEDKYDNAEVYKLKCQDCTQYYFGQMGSRTFNTQYKEHIRDIQNNKDGIGHAQYILNTGHTHGNIQDTMDIIQIKNKRQLMDTIEKYYIYKANKEGIEFNYTTCIQIIRTRYLKHYTTNTIREQHLLPTTTNHPSTKLPTFIAHIRHKTETYFIQTDTT